MNFLSFGLVLAGFTILSCAAIADEANAKHPPVPNYWNADYWEKKSSQNFWKATASKKSPPLKKGSVPLRPSAPAGKKSSQCSIPQLLDRQTEK